MKPAAAIKFGPIAHGALSRPLNDDPFKKQNLLDAIF